MNDYQAMAWQRLWDANLQSVGVDSLRAFMNHGEIIDERRRRHPYPHELCFCLPSDVLFERAQIVMRLLATMRDGDRDIFINGPPADPDDILRTAQFLLMAVPVLWSFDLLKISTSGAEAFEGMPFDPSAFNPPMQLWIPDRDMIADPRETGMETLDSRRKWNACGMLHMAVDAFGQQIGEIVRIRTGTLPPLLSLQIFEAIDTAAIIGSVRFVIHHTGDQISSAYSSQAVAAAEFMRQPITEVRRGGADRAERRRAEKEGRPAPSGYLHVKLRGREGENVRP